MRQTSIPFITGTLRERIVDAASLRDSRIVRREPSVSIETLGY
jgi:hypothetical protein